MESPICPPADPGFRLIETFRWEPGRGILRRELHLARLRRSAARLGIEPVDVEVVLSRLDGDTALRVRLTIDAQGRAEVTSAPFRPLPHGTVWRVALADERLPSGDPWLGVKTTERQIYDTARANLPEGVDEWLFRNERGDLCEGTITNVFARLDPKGKLLTPPLSAGLLPGILRESLLANDEAEARLLSVDDLRQAKEIYVGNSLRGLIPVRLV